MDNLKAQSTVTASSIFISSSIICFYIRRDGIVFSVRSLCSCCAGAPADESTGGLIINDLFIRFNIATLGSRSPR